MKHKFILWPDKPDIRANCLEDIRQLDETKTWDVVISKHVNSKTAEQRSWFHVLCQMWGEQIGMTLGDMKMIVKAKYFGTKQVQFQGMEITVPDGHTENLRLKDYNDLIELIYQMAAESGTVLPPADPYRRVP